MGATKRSTVLGRDVFRQIKREKNPVGKGRWGDKKKKRNLTCLAEGIYKYGKLGMKYGGGWTEKSTNHKGNTRVSSGPTVR